MKTDADTLIMYAFTLRAVGLPEEALTYCLEAVDVSNGREDTVLLGAELMQQCGNTEQAATFLRGWTTRQPSNSEYLTLLGTLLQEMGLTDEAIAAFYQALNADPSGQSAVYGLVPLLIAKGCPTAAADILKEKATQIAEPIYFYVGAATIFARFGSTELAESFLLEAEKRNSGDHEVRHITAAIRAENPPVRASLDYIRSLFDRHATSYDIHLSQLGNSGPTLVSNILKQVITDAKSLDMLDAGCGTGLCGPVLRPLAASLVGVDISAEMLRLALERECYDELFNLDLFALGKNFDGMFDIVICSDVLVYYGLLDRVLASLRRCLKDHGCLVITLEACSDVSGSTLGYEIQPSGRYKHTLRYLCGTLSAVGFNAAPVLKEEVLRYECGMPVDSYTIAATKI